MQIMKWLAAIVAAGMLSCVPATAQKISDLPPATTLSGTEKVPAIQGSGCATHVAPCSNVALTVAQLATLAGSTSQPLDAELTALAAQTTAANRCQYWSGTAAAALYDCTSFMRGLGTSADASAFRSAIGLGTLATQSGTFSGTSSGTNTGDQTTISGNAGTATKLATARNINGVPFDGTAAITINAVDSTARAASGANSDITSLTGLTTPLSMAQGGTGATTPAAARTALSVTQTTALSNGAASSAITGTTAETTFSTGTITFPGNAMGPNGNIEIYAMVSMTGSTNSKTVRIKIGSTTVYSVAVTTASAVLIHPLMRIANRNSTSSQTSGAAGGAALIATAPVPSAIDTTASFSITITGQLANTGETITLESVFARVTYGA